MLSAVDSAFYDVALHGLKQIYSGNFTDAFKAFSTWYESCDVFHERFFCTIYKGFCLELEGDLAGALKLYHEAEGTAAGLEVYGTASADYYYNAIAYKYLSGAYLALGEKAKAMSLALEARSSIMSMGYSKGTWFEYTAQLLRILEATNAPGHLIEQYVTLAAEEFKEVYKTEKNEVLSIVNEVEMLSHLLITRTAFARSMLCLMLITVRIRGLKHLEKRIMSLLKI